MIAAGIVRLYYLSITLHSSDFPFDSTYSGLLTQIEMHYSLMAATIPCMKPFIKAFNTGYLGHTVSQMGGYGTGYGTGYGKGNEYVLQSISSDRGFGPTKAKSGRNLGPLRPDQGDNATVVEHEPAQPSGSMTSDGSEKMIIRQTVGWNVRYDNEGERKHEAV